MAATQSRIQYTEPSLKITPDSDFNVDSVLHVNRGEAAFSSSASSKVSLPAGALFALITSATDAPVPTWSSVQTGPNTSIELNSDLVFINHSCFPSLEFDMVKLEVRVSRDRALKKGDELTFFYPSTEWDMAQPFDCNCNAPDGVCLQRISGARHLEPQTLSKYWVNDHIKALAAEQKGRN